MAWAKVKLALLVGAILIIVSGTAVVAVNEVCNPIRDKTIWTAKSLYSVPPLVVVRPTKLETTEYFVCEERGLGTRYRGRKLPITFALATAYDFSPYRIVFSEAPLTGSFDFLATVTNAQQALRTEIHHQLNLVGQSEMRTTNCLILQVNQRNAPGLKPPKKHSNTLVLEDEAVLSSHSFEKLANVLESILEQPVIDRTKTQEKFDITFKWSAQDKSLESMNRALRDQLGLELVPSREPIKMLVVKIAR